MPLQPLKFRPGINREVTAYTNEGGWRDCDKIRFRAGLPEKIGGWTKLIPGIILGKCRAIHPWTDLSGDRFIGLGTSDKYYVYYDGTLHDITPVRKETDPGKTTVSAATDSLDGDIDATTTSITLSDASDFPEAGYIKIGDEIIFYSGVDTNTLTNCSRGDEGTTADDHTDGAGVFCATLIFTETGDGHGAENDDYVTISGAAGLGGAITAEVLNQEYKIFTPANNSNTTQFYVHARAEAPITDISVNGVYTPTLVFPTASDVGDGGSGVTTEFQISTGLSDAISGLGWGAGGWGTGGWSEPVVTVTSSTTSVRIWTHDNFGEDLLINDRGGQIYYWDVSAWETRTEAPPRAVALSELGGADGFAPTASSQVIISDIDRHVISMGATPEFGDAQDRMVIRFSAQEDITTWRTSEVNTAGELRISSGSEIVTAIKTRQQIIVLTDTAVYAMQFIGAPFTFGINQLSGTISIAGPKAVTSVEDTIYWMGDNEFYVYDGAVRQLPCSVRDYVFDDINRQQLVKVVSGSNTADSEVWWHYPTAGTNEPDKYVVYNYAQDIWYYGTLGRTAWVDRGVFSFPLAACPFGCLFQHEDGLNDGGFSPATGINSYIESSPIDIGDGDQFGFITRMIPDISFLNSSASAPTANLDMKVGNYPGQDLFGVGAGSVTRSVSAPVELFTNKIDTRLRGRTFALRIESTDAGVTWRLGTPRIDVRTDGRR